MNKRLCWCGNETVIPFSNEYVRCSECGTLISVVGLTDEQLKVENDDDAFYGKQYWLEHQSKDLGFPNIFERSRNDLVDRNLHWLKTLLKYKRPPSKVLELGCSHGSFVAMLGHAGYDAAGMEMSPWVVEFARETFDIPVFVGPIETVELENSTYDVLALMDVMEHLPDPVGTLRRALDLLKPDGILLIQTPQFREEMNYQMLVETSGAFLEQFKSDEHLYLFTKDSAARLFRQLGAEYIQFEQPIFHQYDMFFVVSRQPIQQLEPAEAAPPLESPDGRFIQALLDQSARIQKLESDVMIIDADRRLRIDKLEELDQYLKTVDAEGAARLELIEELQGHVSIVDADRQDRLEQIHTLTKMIHDLNDAAKNKN